MTRAEFISEFRSVLEWTDGTFDLSTRLKGHEKWDSIGVLSTMTFVDEELGIEISTKALESVSTVGDLVELVATRLE
jgi:acyl carrier protein